jgi:hypothetical protein
MHRTRKELVLAKNHLERMVKSEQYEIDEVVVIMLDILDDIDNLQFGGE